GRSKPKRSTATPIGAAKTPKATSAPSSTTSTTPADYIPPSAISRPLSSRTNSDKLRNVKQTNPCPSHRISRVSAEGRSPIAFLAYCLHVTLGRRLKGLAPGLTPRSVFETFAAVQMIDVHIPTADGRELQLTRYTQPEPELTLLLHRLKLDLPDQPPPKSPQPKPPPRSPVVPTFRGSAQRFQRVPTSDMAQSANFG